MTSHKLSIKLFADGVPSVAADAFVPIFHSWIRDNALPGHLLIDVADYAHVPDGPGTLIVSHEANIHLDQEDGRPGLLYVRKQPAGDTFEQRLRTVLGSALFAAVALEGDPSLGGKVKFDTARARLRIHDRLNAPNTPATFDAVRPDLERVMSAVYGSPVKLTHKADAERLFEVDIEAAQAPDLKTLQSRT